MGYHAEGCISEVVIEEKHGKEPEARTGMRNLPVVELGDGISETVQTPGAHCIYSQPHALSQWRDVAPDLGGFTSNQLLVTTFNAVD